MPTKGAASAGRPVSRVMGWALTTAGWVIVVVLAVFALLRVVAWDSLEPLVVIDALTLIAYAPAWIVCIVALATRRVALGMAAIVVVVAQVIFLAPELLASSPLPGWTAHATKITVLDANIDKAHSLEGGYVHVIDSSRPDVIALEEVRPAAYAEMLSTGVLRRYPHRCAAPAPGPSGFLVAARLPVIGCVVRTMRDQGRGYARPYLVEATLKTAAGPVALRVVHTLAPLPSSWRETAAELVGVAAAVRRGGATRMLMMGDFNATWNNKGFVAIMDEGLTDGAAARGNALDMTWPNGALVPPFVRIDHILTGSDLAVVSIRSHAGCGSDHQFLTATVAIQDPHGASSTDTGARGDDGWPSRPRVARWLRCATVTECCPKERAFNCSLAFCPSLPDSLPTGGPARAENPWTRNRNAPRSGRGGRLMRCKPGPHVRSPPRNDHSTVEHLDDAADFDLETASHHRDDAPDDDLHHGSIPSRRAGISVWL